MSSTGKEGTYVYGGFGRDVESATSIYHLLDDHASIRGLPEEREKKIIRALLDKSLKKKLAEFGLKSSKV